MTDGGHVLVRRMLSTECLVADLAVKCWSPVACSIHVLVTGTPGSETCECDTCTRRVIVANVVGHGKVGLEVAK